MLKVSKISKTFGDVVALKDVSFEAGNGDFIFITGPSGSGKTTLLRLILRELLPDSGEITIDNVKVTELPSKQVPQLRRQIGVVFQDFKVLPERTIRENIEVALAVSNVEQTSWDEKVENALKEVGIVDKIDFFPSQLSGGELQRVSLARAIVANPKLILADEPTGNLDWDTSFGIMKLLEEFNKKGKTVIMATHHQLIVDKMKKKVVNLSEPKDKKPEPKKTEEKKTTSSKKK